MAIAVGSSSRRPVAAVQMRVHTLGRTDLLTDIILRQLVDVRLLLDELLHLTALLNEGAQDMGQHATFQATVGHLQDPAQRAL
jgi:hypothetical protein